MHAGLTRIDVAGVSSIKQALGTTLVPAATDADEQTTDPRLGARDGAVPTKRFSRRRAPTNAQPARRFPKDTTDRPVSA